MNLKSADEVLKYIIDNHSIKILLNGKKCKAMISDLAPNLQEVCKMLFIAFDNNAVNILVDVDSESAQKRQGAYNMFVKHLIDVAYLNTEAANKIAMFFVKAMDWNIKIPSNTPAPNIQPNVPVTKIKQPNNPNISSSPKKSNASVQVTIPYQWNKLNSTIQKNKYVVKNNKPQSIGVACVLIVVIVIAISSGKSKSEKEIAKPIDSMTTTVVETTTAALNVVNEDSEEISKDSNDYSDSDYSIENLLEAPENNDSDLESDLSINKDFDYLGKDILSYDNNYYKEINDTSSFILGNVTYYKGFTMVTCQSCYASYNVDGANIEAYYIFYGDGDIIDTLNIVEGELPVQFDVNISRVKQLTISTSSKNYSNRDVGFANATFHNKDIADVKLC